MAITASNFRKFEQNAYRLILTKFKTYPGLSTRWIRWLGSQVLFLVIRSICLRTIFKRSTLLQDQDRILRRRSSGDSNNLSLLYLLANHTLPRSSRFSTTRELWECISMFSQVTKSNPRYRTFSLRPRSQPKRYKWLIVKVKETIQLIKEERDIRRYRRSTRVERSLTACGPCGLRVLWGFKLDVPLRSKPFLCNSWSGFEF